MLDNALEFSLAFALLAVFTLVGLTAVVGIIWVTTAAYVEARKVLEERLEKGRK